MTLTKKDRSVFHWVIKKASTEELHRLEEEIENEFAFFREEEED